MKNRVLGLYYKKKTGITHRTLLKGDVLPKKSTPTKKYIY